MLLLTYFRFLISYYLYWITTVWWPYRLDAHRLHSLLAFGRRTYRPSISERTCVDPNLSEELVFQTLGFPLVVIYHVEGESNCPFFSCSSFWRLVRYSYACSSPGPWVPLPPFSLIQWCPKFLRFLFLFWSWLFYSSDIWRESTNTTICKSLSRRCLDTYGQSHSSRSFHGFIILFLLGYCYSFGFQSVYLTHLHWFLRSYRRSVHHLIPFWNPRLVTAAAPMPVCPWMDEPRTFFIPVNQSPYKHRLTLFRVSIDPQSYPKMEARERN